MPPDDLTDEIDELELCINDSETNDIIIKLNKDPFNSELIIKLANQFVKYKITGLINRIVNRMVDLIDK